jgi:hypothetical protein
MKTKTVKMIEVSDWDKLVQETYGRPYSFQQQNGCQDRGTFQLEVPSTECYDFEDDTIPEVVNGDEMGVSFKAWLARDPKQKLPGCEEGYCLDLFWERNFYPCIEMVANDLHAKGLLEAGEYTINIDW